MTLYEKLTQSKEELIQYILDKNILYATKDNKSASEPYDLFRKKLETDLDSPAPENQTEFEFLKKDKINFAWFLFDNCEEPFILKNGLKTICDFCPSSPLKNNCEDERCVDSILDRLDYDEKEFLSLHKLSQEQRKQYKAKQNELRDNL